MLYLRRLYSTFADGWPGVGLLLIRLVVATGLAVRSCATSWNDFPAIGSLIPIFAIGYALLILCGLWTPIVGTLIALLETWQILTVTEDRMVGLLLATMGAALAMLGPGWWSADAHLFGWRRIQGRGNKAI